MTESNLVSKVCNFAHVLRDDGVGYGDYLEQIIIRVRVTLNPKNNK